MEPSVLDRNAVQHGRFSLPFKADVPVPIPVPRCGKQKCHRVSAINELRLGRPVPKTAEESQASEYHDCPYHPIQDLRPD